MDFHVGQRVAMTSKHSDPIITHVLEVKPSGRVVVRTWDYDPDEDPATTPATLEFIHVRGKGYREPLGPHAFPSELYWLRPATQVEIEEADARQSAAEAAEVSRLEQLRVHRQKLAGLDWSGVPETKVEAIARMLGWQPQMIEDP